MHGISLFLQYITVISLLVTNRIGVVVTEKLNKRLESSKIGSKGKYTVKLEPSGPYCRRDIPDITFILEPGRFLTAEAGILVARVQYVKENLYGKRFLIVDTGMHHLIRSPLYGGYHSIIPVRKNSDTMIEADVVGPICESTDFLGKERLIEKVCQNDLLAVTDAGAYGIVLASHYNSHSLPVEVLVDGSRYKVIRRRETYEDLLNSEVNDFKVGGY